MWYPRWPLPGSNLTSHWQQKNLFENSNDLNLNYKLKPGWLCFRQRILWLSLTSKLCTIVAMPGHAPPSRVRVWTLKTVRGQFWCATHGANEKYVVQNNDRSNQLCTLYNLKWRYVLFCGECVVAFLKPLKHKRVLYRTVSGGRFPRLRFVDCALVWGGHRAECPRSQVRRKKTKGPWMAHVLFVKVRAASGNVCSS